MAALPWIKVAIDLPRHEKSLQLRIDTQEPWAWGHLVLLWMACARHKPDGTFHGRGCEFAIEDYAEWRGKRGLFVEACVRCGFLDETTDGYRIHDWDKWAGAHIEHKRKDRERKARSRHADSPGDVPREVTRKSRGRSKGSRADNTVDAALEGGPCHADSPVDRRLKTQETLRSTDSLDQKLHVSARALDRSSAGDGLEAPTKHLVEVEPDRWEAVDA